MRNNLKSMIAATLCGATAFSALPPEALAGPMGVAPPAVVGLNAPTTEVHYYRRYWGHRHYGYWRPYRHHWRYRHWGYWRPYHRHWRYRHWGYWRPYYRYYRYPYYSYGYNPAGSLFAGAALGLMGAGLAAATAPAWGWGWGPGWGWGRGWGWGGWW
ncbi:hypothetical protein ACNHKD_15305 [Methylocystis sp. JAN1]|uniref:hypothetical protein n=1 Tax=Methylocystis sp. JAN1 TaxID=3397211 RepID=UPI003FA267E7